METKLVDFRTLSQREQCYCLYRNGTYIGKLKKEGYTSLLYQLDSFYVEITYRKYRCLIAAMRCFESTEGLEPYLEQIPVGEWIN